MNQEDRTPRPNGSDEATSIRLWRLERDSADHEIRSHRLENDVVRLKTLAKVQIGIVSAVLAPLLVAVLTAVLMRR